MKFCKAFKVDLGCVKNVLEMGNRENTYLILFKYGMSFNLS